MTGEIADKEADCESWPEKCTVCIIIISHICDHCGARQE